ncbi:uncharacterized protein LOC135828792 isoform X2 [Sycon ciliatum]|uniref:uncharacterized protein LOC135828792 isoform X2 n=1 Tax=Sycon ciliatum TaxID=27933 RepID=UPI0031F6C8C9
MLPMTILERVPFFSLTGCPSPKAAFIWSGWEQLAAAPRHWRESMSSEGTSPSSVHRGGAFAGWRVMLMVADKTKLEAFKRLVRAGGGVIVSLQRGSFLKPNSVKVSRLTHAFCAEASWRDVLRAVSGAGMTCLHPDFIPEFLLKLPPATIETTNYLTTTYKPHVLTSAANNRSSPGSAPVRTAPAGQENHSSVSTTPRTASGTRSSESTPRGTDAASSKQSVKASSSVVFSTPANDTTQSSSSSSSQPSSTPRATHSRASAGKGTAKTPLPSPSSPAKPPKQVPASTSSKPQQAAESVSASSDSLVRRPLYSRKTSGDGSQLQHVPPAAGTSSPDDITIQTGVTSKSGGAIRDRPAKTTAQASPSSSPSATARNGSSRHTRASSGKVLLSTRRSPVDKTNDHLRPASPAHTALELLSKRLSTSLPSSPVDSPTGTTSPRPSSPSRSALNSLSQRLEECRKKQQQSSTMSPVSSSAAAGGGSGGVKAQSHVSTPRSALSTLHEQLARARENGECDAERAGSPATSPARKRARTSWSPARDNGALASSLRTTRGSRAASNGGQAAGRSGSSSNSSGADGSAASAGLASLLSGSLSGSAFSRTASAMAEDAAHQVAVPPLSRSCSSSPALPLSDDDEFHSARSSPCTPTPVGTAKLQRYMSSSLSRRLDTPKPVKRALSFSKAMANGGAHIDEDDDDDIIISGEVPPPAKRVRSTASNTRECGRASKKCRQHSLTAAEILDSVNVSAMRSIFPEISSGADNIVRDASAAAAAAAAAEAACVGPLLSMPTSSRRARLRPLDNRFSREWDEITKMYCGSDPQPYVHLHCIQIAMATPVLPSPESLNSVFHQCMLECTDTNLSCTASRVLDQLLQQQPPHFTQAITELYWRALVPKDNIESSFPSATAISAPSPLVRDHDLVFRLNRHQLKLALAAFENESSDAGVTYFCNFLVKLLRRSLQHCAKESTSGAQKSSQTSSLPSSLLHYLLWTGGNGQCTGVSESLRRLLAVAVKLSKRLNKLSTAAVVTADLSTSSSSSNSSDSNGGSTPPSPLLYHTVQRLSLLLDVIGMAAECCKRADTRAGTRTRQTALVRELQLSCSTISPATMHLLGMTKPEWLRTDVAWRLLEPRLSQMKVCAERSALDLAFSSSDSSLPGVTELTAILVKLTRKCRRSAKEELLKDERNLKMKQETYASGCGSPVRRPAAVASITSPINKRNTKGESKLQQSCIKGKVDRVRELLAIGADPNMCDHAGWTALHEAANFGHVECVRALLEYGTTVMPGQPGLYLLAAPQDGVTPLHDAVTNGHVEVARLIVNAGGPAVLRAATLEGHTPLDVCPSGDHFSELRSLLCTASDTETELPQSQSQSLTSSPSRASSPGMVLLHAMCVPPLRDDPELLLVTRLTAIVLSTVALSQPVPAAGVGA